MYKIIEEKHSINFLKRLHDNQQNVWIVKAPQI